MITIKESDIDPISRWHIGPRIWKINGEWRIKLYRPWNKSRFVEAQSENFLVTLYVLGVGAGWWKPIRKD